MEKSVLYIAYVDELKNDFPGVEEKIAAQCSTMRSAGYRVDRICPYGRSACFVHTASGERRLGRTHVFVRFAVYDAVREAVSRHAYFAAYIRFQFFSEDVRRILVLLRRHGVRVLMEFPTFPYRGELRLQGWRGVPKDVCDRLFCRVCTRHIDRFVTQAENETIYGVPCIQVKNGLDYASHPLRRIRQPVRGEIHLAAVASMLPWHGYERILWGMADYSDDVRFVLHLVGEGRELSRYRSITAERALSDRVIFHGKQSGEALFEIVSQCDLAVGSLAAGRIGLTMLSTLKSREYCAWGLPSIHATPVDILDADDPFCLFVPETEEAVDMRLVEAFFYRVYWESGMSVEEIARSIRTRAERCSDVRVTFQAVLDDLAGCEA